MLHQHYPRLLSFGAHWRGNHSSLVRMRAQRRGKAISTLGRRELLAKIKRKGKLWAGKCVFMYHRQSIYLCLFTWLRCCYLWRTFFSPHFISFESISAPWQGICYEYGAHLIRHDKFAIFCSSSRFSAPSYRSFMCSLHESGGKWWYMECS